MTATVRVRVPAALRDLTAGESSVQVELADGGVTVGAVLDALGRTHPALERRVRDELGAVRPHVNLFVGGDNVRDLAGTDSAVPAGSDVSIVPAVSGG